MIYLILKMYTLNNRHIVHMHTHKPITVTLFLRILQY